jgi:DNA mismatch repair protein MutL
LKIGARTDISQGRVDAGSTRLQGQITDDGMLLTTDAAPRIRTLSASLINKIAAGEVIERPANVLKELLENSVDALATRIDVEIAHGGSELIRVTDDGEGIRGEDLVLAVSSHATSKLREAEDLFCVRTMGFRGEALASIAEVSRLRLQSRPPDAPEGFELTVEAGHHGEVRPCGCPAGTQVEVRELFLNTPVRRRFLKAQATEFGHLAEQFTRVALAHRQLRMSLRHNGRAVFDLLPAEQLRDRVKAFFGGELAGKLIDIDGQTEEIRLWGCVAHPGVSRSTRKGQYLYLNGRWIQDRSVQHALGEAYRGLLMTGRYPVAFLFLELPPEEVDVNVHPTKSEVRFRDPQTLYRLVRASVREVLSQADLNAPLTVVPARGARGGAVGIDIDPEVRQQAQLELVSWATEALTNWQPPAEEAAGDGGGAGDEESPVHGPGGDVGGVAGVTGADVLSDERRTDEPHEGPPVAIVRVLTDEAAARPASAAAELRAMQVHDCYLVVETVDGVSVIDQHALHERILYERLRSRVLEGELEVQRLLVPYTVDLPAREAALLVEHADLLAQLGLSLESFGGSTVALTALPALLHRARPEELLRSLIDLLEEHGPQATRRDLLDSLLHMLACKAAIKAGQRLSSEEISALLSQQRLVGDSHHCPHGRPTALTLTRAALDRQFGRLG